MASMFAHAITAVAIGKSLQNRSMPRRFWALMLVSSILPDIDVIGFAFGIQYGDFFGHRGFSHSLGFASIWAALLSMWLFRENRWRIFFMLFFATASHGVLDAMTNGGLGIAFFSPFDNTRYFFDYRPILVSPIGVGAFFSEWGLRVLVSEAFWVGVPCTLMLLLTYIYRKIGLSFRLEK